MPPGTRLGGGETKISFFQNRDANAFALVFHGVLYLHSNERAPKVPFLEIFMEDSIFEAF